MTIETTAVNPVDWSLPLGFSQGRVVQGEARTLYISGQTAVDAAGTPQHDGDPAAQLALATDNLEGVLAAAGMTLADLVRLTVYATDIEGLLPHYGELAGRLGAAGVSPVMTMVEITRLAVPGQVVEIEGVAVA